MEALGLFALPVISRLSAAYSLLEFERAAKIVSIWKMILLFQMCVRQSII